MNPLLLSLALLAPAQPPAQPNANDVGVLPVGADGKPLNLDFETGTLKDWTAEGDAFEGQPIKGDTVVAAARRHEEPAPGPVLDRRLREARRQADGHAHERAVQGHASVGELPRRRRAARTETCVETRRRQGRDLPRVAASRRRTCAASSSISRSIKGKEIFIRLVDKHTGHWGHINFDDFRFHAAEAERPGAAEGRAAPRRPMRTSTRGCRRKKRPRR